MLNPWKINKNMKIFLILQVFQLKLTKIPDPEWIIENCDPCKRLPSLEGSSSLSLLCQTVHTLNQASGYPITWSKFKWPELWPNEIVDFTDFTSMSTGGSATRKYLFWTPITLAKWKRQCFGSFHYIQLLILNSTCCRLTQEVKRP